MKKIFLMLIILASCSTMQPFEDCERTFHGHCVAPEDCPDCELV